MIKNLRHVSDDFATSGQPTELELAELAQSGFRAVINLGLLDPKYCLPDETGTARSLGLAYEHVPVRFDAPRAEDFERFSTLLSEAERPVLVHCALNYRATCFFSLWAEAELGWSREQADAFIADVWTPDAVWRAFLEEQRSKARHSLSRRSRR
jgi:uncharacterized protein (TIGR01244 family)